MTADVELLPLPVRNYVDDDGLWETATGPYSAEETQAYARAVAEHNVKKRDAEIEALRAELEDYRTNGAAAVRFAPGSAYWSDELHRLFGGDARTGIEVLESRYQQERTRVERLTKALRELVAVFTESGMYDEEVFDKARAALDQEPPHDR